MRFCDKLSKLRKNNNLSQEQLADRLGVSRQAVSKWEAGSSYPDMDKMIQICGILNCTLEELLDDGVIKGGTNNTKPSVTTYTGDLLNFITKSYNMFCSMTGKDKIKCIGEMSFLGIVLLILGYIVLAIADVIVSNLLAFIPYEVKYTIMGIVNNIFVIGLLIFGIVVFLHLFKIRYLDYFITIEDKNVKEKTIEESIEKKENKNYIEKDKEKVIIRDPEHSSFSFFNFLGKMIIYVFKFFIVLFLIPVICIFLFLIFSSVVSMTYIPYNILFFMIAMAIIGGTLITYTVVELTFKFIFDRSQNLKRIFIIFLVGLILVGVGTGLSFVKIVNFDYTEKNANLTMKESTEYLDFNPDMTIETYTNDENYIIDNSLSNIKIDITYPDIFEYYIHQNGVNYYINNVNISSFNMYKVILKDIKEDKISNYDVYDYSSVKIYLSEEHYNIIKQNNNKLNTTYYQ